MKKILNLRPIAIISLSFMSGIFFAYLKFKFNVSYIYLVLLSILFVIPLFNKNKKFISYLFVLIVVVCFISGMFNFNSQLSKYSKAQKQTDVYNIEGTVSEINSINNYTSVTLTNIKINQENNNYKIKIYINGNLNYKLNDRIAVSSNLFSYEMKDSKIYYRILNKLRYYAYVNQSDIYFKGEKNNIFFSIRNKIENILDNGMDEDTASLSKALLIGDVGGVDADLLQNFRYGGIAHIFSVSGLHIALISVLLIFLLKKVRINKILKSFIIMSILIIYSGVCGFSASSVRASIMCSTYLLIKAIGNKPDSLNSLFLSFLIVLLLSPVNLFDVGFQLSFIVTFFIITLNYPCKKTLKFLPEKIASSFAVIIPATISSLPILLMNFGYVSVLSMMLNFIFVPVLSLIFVFLFISILLCFLIPFYSIILFLPNLFLNAISGVFMIFDYSNFILSGIKLSGFAIVYYLIIAILSDKINLKKLIKKVAVTTLAIVFIAGVIIINVPQNTVKLSMFKCGYGYYLIINHKNENILVCDGSGLNSYTLSEQLSLIGENNITCVVIVGGNEYLKIKNIESCVNANCFYICSDNEISGIKTEIVNTESFERGNIKFYYNGENSLHIDILNCDILFNISGTVNNNYNVVYDLVISDSFNEEIQNFYENTKTVFYKKTEGFIDAESSCGLLFNINNGKMYIRF